jgi:hypothetical protein
MGRGGYFMLTRLILTIVVALFLAPALPLNGQEHPKKEGEHPKEKGEHPKKEGEHPEHPEKAKGQKDVSTADISAGIKKNIESATKKSKDGKFHVKHEGQDLALDLVKVHDDRLSSLGGGKYFACVDMKAADGKTYDIDFFMSGKPDRMKVTETAVHKVEGKPLYNWEEKDGKWKKVPVS